SADTSDMEGVLPDEFPFNRRRAAAEAVAPPMTPAPQVIAPVIAAPAAPELPPAPVAAAAGEQAESETLVEVAAGPRVLYRGRERFVHGTHLHARLPPCAVHFLQQHQVLEILRLLQP